MGQKRESTSKNNGSASKKTKKQHDTKTPNKKKKEKLKTLPIPENEELELSQEDIKFFSQNKTYLNEFEESIEKVKKEPLKKHISELDKGKVKKIKKSESLEEQSGSENEDMENYEDVEDIEGEESDEEIDEDVSEEEEELVKEEEIKEKTIIKKENTRKKEKNTKEENKEDIKKDSKEKNKKGNSFHNENDITKELQMYEQKQMNKLHIKERIATLCTAILENPEKMVEQIKEVHEYCSHDNISIRKIAIISECTIYKDIIPSYRIRLPTEQELKAGISKDVRKVLMYETFLLQEYKQFLKYIEPIANGKEKTSEVLQIACVRCLCELLKTHPHFNFSSNIVNLLCPLLTSPNKKIIENITTTFNSVFEFDQNGETTLEIVKSISSFIKSKSYNLRSDVMDMFLNLKFTDGISDVNVFAPNQKVAKKKKKTDKELDRDLKETEAIKNTEDRKRTQTETLRAVFVTYFRILKKANYSPLLGSTLKGIANFSHLINLEIVIDMIEVLRDLLSNENNSHVREEDKLQCIVSVFQILKAQDTLSIDLKDFYTHLYNLLPFVVVNQSSIPLMLKALQLMFLEKKQIAFERLCAFVKRLACFSLHLPPSAAVPILSFIHSLMMKFPRIQQLLDNDHIATGNYLPETPDPEHCNASSSSLWELTLLKQHWHPIISQSILKIGKENNELLFGNKGLIDLYKSYDTSSGGFNPPIKLPKIKLITKKKKK